MGTALLIGFALAFIVLGPERMHSMLGHLGRAKGQLDKVSQELELHLAIRPESVRVPPKE